MVLKKISFASLVTKLDYSTKKTVFFQRRTHGRESQKEKKRKLIMQTF